MNRDVKYLSIGILSGIFGTTIGLKLNDFPHRHDAPPAQAITLEQPETGYAEALKQAHDNMYAANRESTENQIKAVSTYVNLLTSSPEASKEDLDYTLYYIMLKDELPEDNIIQWASQLLDAGANIDAGRDDRRVDLGWTGGVPTPLVQATENLSAKVVKFLIDRGADVNVGKKSIGVTETPLSSILKGIAFNGGVPATQDQLDKLRLLLDAGADTNVINERGMRPMNYAMFSSQTAERVTNTIDKFILIADMLKSYDANPLLKDGEGLSFYEHARREYPDNAKLHEYLKDWESSAAKAAPAARAPKL